MRRPFVTELDAVPLSHVRYLNAAKGGGTESARLPIVRGRVSDLPDGLDALIATSDLQGIVPDPRTHQPTLLGCALAEVLEELCFDGALPPAERCGVLLAGDLYSVPGADKRGGFGDVAPVWHAFAERFAWVAGVAGNHDDTSAIATSKRVHLLDTEVRTIAGVGIGGVGYVIGNPDKRGRRAEDEQLERFELVALTSAEILLCHEGPDGGPEQAGNSAIRAVVEEYAVPLTICGHVHWDDPLHTLASGQILNVDSRVVVLTRANRIAASV